MSRRSWPRSLERLAPGTPELSEGSELLVRGGWVWLGPTAAAEDDLLEDAAVVCRAGRVAEIGAYADLRVKYPAAREIGTDKALVLPGLINAHHHGRGIDPVMLGSADAALEVWLADRAGEPLVDPYLDTLWAAANLLARGVTTIVHFVLTPDPRRALEHAEARLRAWRDAGIRVALGLDVRQQRFLVYEDEERLLAGLPPEVAAEVGRQERGRQPLSGSEYIDLFEELANRHSGVPNASFFLAPAGPQWVTDETLGLIAQHSREHGTRVHTHTLETPFQREAARRLYGGSVVEHLHSHGLLGPRTSLVHGVWLSESDIGLLAATGTNVIHNPGANLRLSSGVAPVPALLEAGVNVALGTDGFTLSQDDLLTEARLAYQLHRRPGRAATNPTPRSIMHAMTAGAAATTPFGDDIGGLKVDAAADLTLIDLGAATRPYMAPGVDPLEACLLRADGAHVMATVVAGEVVAENGKPSRMDMPALAEELRKSVHHRPREFSGAVAAAIREHYQGRWEPSLANTHWPLNSK